MIAIDGSHGEEGGRIPRTAPGLSHLFRKPFRMFDMRRGRPRPGLMPPHLAAVGAARRISGAQVSGDAPGSTGLVFSRGETRGGESEFTTSRVTRHLPAGLGADGLFRPFRFDVEGELGKPGRVRIRP